MIRILLLQGFVTRARAIIRRTRASSCGSIVNELIRYSHRFVVIIASFFFFSPCQLPYFVINEYPSVLCLRAIVGIYLSIRFICIFFVDPFRINFNIYIFFFWFRPRFAKFSGFLLFVNRFVHKDTLAV